MPTLRCRHDVAAPAAEVWAVLADVASLPSMSRGTVSVEVAGPLVAPGQQFTQTVRLGGKLWTSQWVVVHLVPDECMALDGQLAPGVGYRLVEQLTPTGATSCTLDISGTYQLPFGPLGRLASRLGVERRVHHELGDVVAAVADRAERAWRRSRR